METFFSKQVLNGKYQFLSMFSVPEDNMINFHLSQNIELLWASSYCHPSTPHTDIVITKFVVICSKSDSIQKEYHFNKNKFLEVFMSLSRISIA